MDVDAVIGVAQVAGDRLVLDEPAVDAVGVQRGEPAQPRRGLERLLVGPDGVLAHVVADAQRPVRGVALERAVRRRLRALEQVGVDVGERDVGHRQDPGLVQQVRAGRVEHERVADERAQAAAVGLEEDLVRRATRTCSSRRPGGRRAVRCRGSGSCASPPSVACRTRGRRARPRAAPPSARRPRRRRLRAPGGPSRCRGARAPRARSGRGCARGPRRGAGGSTCDPGAASSPSSIRRLELLEVRHALAVIARGLRDERDLARREARQAGVEDEIARVLVVVVVVDRHADVVQHARAPQQLALPAVAGMQAGRGELVEERRARAGRRARCAPGRRGSARRGSGSSSGARRRTAAARPRGASRRRRPRAGRPR